MAKKGDKKGKGKDAAAAGSAPMITVSSHPRAQRSILRTKAYAGLAGFVLVGFFSYQAGVEPFEVGLRALIAGMACYLAAWGFAVTLWQKLVVAEAQAEADRIREAHEEALAAIKAAQEAEDAANKKDTAA